MKTCVLIPALNEEKHIASLVKNVRVHVPHVLVVDDGSSDETRDRASSAGASVLRHPKNQGKGVALSNGFKWASENGFDAVITMDGDAQHDPEEIPLFIECARKTGADIVLGNRLHDTKDMPFLRKATNYLTSYVIDFSGGISIHDSQVGYRLLRTRMLKRMRLKGKKYDQESEILVKAGRLGYVVREVPIRTIYLGGPSKIHPIIDSFRFARMMVKFYL